MTRHRSAAKDGPNSPASRAVEAPVAAGVTRRAFWAGLVGVTVVGLLLGLLHLGRNDIWFDEAATFRFARPSGASFFRTLVTRDTHGPLYYGFMHFWLRAFGETAVSGRLPSVLCAAGGVMVVGLLGARVFGRAVGLLAALLVALSPMHVHYAQEVRFYSFVELAVASHVLCFIVLVGQRPPCAHPDGAQGRRPAWGAVAGFALTGAACLLTFYLSATVLIAEAVCAAVLWRNVDRRRVVLAFAGVALGFAPWLYGFLYQLRHNRGFIDWVSDAGAWNFVCKLYTAYVRGANTSRGWPELVTAPLFVGCALAGAAMSARRGRRGALATLLWLAVPLGLVLFVSQWKRLYVTRYLLMVLPAFFLLAAAGAWRAPRGWQRAGLAAAMALALGAGLVRHHSGLKRSERWRDAVAFLGPNLQATDLVAVSPGYEVVTLDHYLPAHRRKAGVGFPADVLRSVQPGKRVWMLTYQERDRDFASELGRHLEPLGSREFGSLELSWFAIPR